MATNAPTTIRLLSGGIILLSLSGCVTELTVSRSTASSLSNSNADSILRDFSEAINTADSGSDFACAEEFGTDFLPALYLRDGSVTVNNAPTEINSQADFNAVIGAPGYAKVVEEINWCGELLPNVIGCAPVPGDSFAVVRFTGNAEGILWAHEYGHTVGLSHTSGASRVMRGTINTANDEVTSDECISFVSKYNPDWPNAPQVEGGDSRHPALLAALGGRSATGVSIDGHLDHEMGPLPADVAEFVRQTYIHGTPMSAALRYRGSDAARRLEAMLLDPAERAHHGNIVAVLGAVGDARSATILRDYLLARAQLEVDGAQRRVLTATLMGLGYLAHSVRDGTALQTLLQASDPSFWGGSAAADSLARAAHIGLALSGREEARGALAGQRDRGLPSVMADELLQAHARVASVGLEGYYAHAAD